MNRRTAIILASLVTSGICFGILFTNYYPLLGFLIGFQIGLINIQWLFKDLRKVIDKDINSALRTYVLSLFSRLGLVTMIVVIIERYQHDWIFLLAVGIAVGVLIPLMLAIKQIKSGRG